MKKIIVLALIVSSSILHTSGQGLNVTPNTKQLDQLKADGITVVIPENKFGETLQKIVKEHWTATEFKFISEKELTKFENGQKVNLLGFFQGEFQSAKHYLKNTPFIGITKKYKEKNNYADVSKNKDTYAAVLYPSEGVKESDLEATILLDIKILNNLISSGGFKPWISTMKKSGKEARAKTIIACKDDFESSLADVKKKYKGKIKLVSREEYNSAILNNDEVLIFQDVRTSTSYLFSIISNTGFPHYTMFASTMNLTKAYQLMLFKGLAKL